MQQFRIDDHTARHSLRPLSLPAPDTRQGLLTPRPSRSRSWPVTPPPPGPDASFPQRTTAGLMPAERTLSCQAENHTERDGASSG